MAAEPLRAVLIGAGSLGANTLRALCSSPLATVAGVSDQDKTIASAAAATAGCPAYSDHRRLLAQTRPRAVFLAVPPEAIAALVPLAAEYQANVWAAAPFARNLPEAVALCRLMSQAGLRLAVGTPRRFMSGYGKARAWLGRLGRLFLLEAHYLFNAGAVLAWRADAQAGGGALRELGSHIFDLVVGLGGLPETIYCLAGTGQRQAGLAGQPLYDTDDSAACVLRWLDRTAGAVTLSRCYDPVSEGLSLYGEAGSLHAATSRCTLRNRDGAVIEQYADEEPPADVFIRQIDAFVGSVAAGGAEYECSGWENLLTMAVIDAAYLSCRTGQPESPGDLLAKYSVAPADCLKLVPKRN